MEAVGTCCSCDCKGFNSEIETAILNSTGEPADINEIEPINVNGEMGIHANKTEADNWSGPYSLNKYPINKDDEPIVVTKVPNSVECHRDVTVKYLEPPSIPTPGPIIINQAQNILPPVAPPVIIRQVPCIPVEPPPLVIREAPPKIPLPPKEKVITIPGEMLPPPPRKVVIEKLPELPDKPQDVHIERWLPFKDIKRRIILNPQPPDPVQCKPRNIIINWEKRKCCNIITNIKNLGIEKADPAAYVLAHGSSLLKQSQMPEIAEQVKKEHNMPLAADNTAPYYMELEGDIHALELFDLDKEGLSEYKFYLNHCKKCNQPNEIVFVQPKGSPAPSVAADKLGTPVASRPETRQESDKSSFEAVKPERDGSSDQSKDDAIATSQQVSEPSNFLTTVLTGNEMQSTEESTGTTSTEHHITMSFENTTQDEHTNEQNGSFDEITSEVDNLIEHKQVVTTEELIFEATATEEFVNQNTTEDEITEK